ncbi:membrane protein [Legionella brunensis]|uniref:Membrane protein n=2 Tax=Legionella brunensis TaxID=29422 RepID=A0A0W0SK89_9GAMM|nr:membrane protein [Legionella brunensis]
MNLMNIKTFFIALVIFIILDFIWLGLVAKNLYIEHYKDWLRLSDHQLRPIWWATFLVYALFALSIVIFIQPLANNSLFHATLYGALLGLIIYGIYDFTCLAIFKNWPIHMAFIDLAWGIMLCSLSSVLTIWIGSWMNI